jgi:hypothetical protein
MIARLNDALPLLVEFVAGSSLELEQDRPSQLAIHRNGPPGTFVRLGRLRISLPTDQIVCVHEQNGAVIVGFGGMRFSEIRDGRLTFVRVRDLRPEAELSPARSWTMTLEPEWIAAVYDHGCRAWPPLPRSDNRD